MSHFNIDFKYDVEVSDLLPPNQFLQRPFLFDEDLEAMLTEISCDNQDAFREILRMDPLPGRTKPRLAYARNFFGSLEDMARYWDTSKDNYYHVPIDSKTSSTNTVARSSGTSTGMILKSNQSNGANQDIEMKDVDPDAPNSTSQTSSEEPQTKEVYKGYRFGNGEQINPGTRVAMVKNLLKMVMHKFLCRDHEPMPAPREKLAIRGVRIQSIQYHFCVARIPKDTKLARQRLVEGPIMAVHCREEVRFKPLPTLPSPQDLLTDSATVEGTNSSKPPTPTKPLGPKLAPSGSAFVGERYDLFREIGAMLILATQRERAGKSKETVSGADKWWVTEKRWGNGPLKWGQLAYEIYEDEDPSWGPQEKQLQDEKRQKEANEREKGKGVDALLSGAATTPSVDELMANNAPLLPAIPGEPLGGPRKKKLRSLERPPGKEDETKDGRRLMYVPPFRKKWYQDWQKLRPNTPMWDDKIIYKHTGKAENAEFDDIYMVTSVNHHVALLRMRVHPSYIAWLELGLEASEESVEGLRKDVLHVQRSEWFDMFDVKARQEFLVALWRVMCWLNRDNIDSAEYQKMEERRKAQGLDERNA